MEQERKARSRRITSEHVANAAGVSRSAVSRAFTVGAYLDKGKRTKILKVAQELGYRPNALAAGLQGEGRSNLVAIVTGSLANHYDGDVLSLLVRGLNVMGKWPVIVGGSEDMSEAEVLNVLAYPLDALILRGGSVDESVTLHCSKLNVPLIVSGRILRSKGVDCVCCDNRRGAEMAVSQLLQKGRTRLGYIGGREHLSSDQERKAGFEFAVRRAGLLPEAIVQADYSHEGGYRLLSELIRSGRELDGLFCANDAMALGAIAAARREFGMSVPKDLSVIGFDDLAMAAWPEFGLSTIRNDMERTVSHVLRMLEERLNAPEKQGETVLIEPEFISRNTH